MRRVLHALEPVLWPLFGGGFFVVAIAYPSVSALAGVVDAIGWLPTDALAFDRVAEATASPLGRLVVAGLVVLPLWNGAFHLRHTAMDLLGNAADRFVGPALYAIAAVGTAAIAIALSRL